jgi:hypothetical protein
MSALMETAGPLTPQDEIRGGEALQINVDGIYISELLDVLAAEDPLATDLHENPDFVGSLWTILDTYREPIEAAHTPPNAAKPFLSGFLYSHEGGRFDIGNPEQVILYAKKLSAQQPQDLS